MAARWTISRWPTCAYDVFISHCAEDREKFAQPLYQLLCDTGIIPWADWEEYPLGARSEQALRDALVACRHIVYLITPAFRRQSRGWTAMEKAYGGLIQKQFIFEGDEWLRYELPLFFDLDRGQPEIDQTIWRLLRDKGSVCNVTQRNRVAWAANLITAFVDQGYALAAATKLRFKLNSEIIPKIADAEPNTWQRTMSLAPRLNE